MTSAGTSTLRFATRGSSLALRQTELALEALRQHEPGLQGEIVEITTRGDVDRQSSLTVIGGQGVFVRAVEQALLAGEADVAVHSLKDVPTEVTAGLTLAAVLRRADPRDVLVASGGRRLADLPPGARIGTSSRRRAALLHAIRPDIEAVEVRGNVDTRVRKVREGELDGVLLAAAGLARLDRLDEATQLFDAAEFLPSPGQGVIVLQCRSDDEPTLALLRRADDAETRAAVEAERGFLAALGSGCSLPAGAYARVEGELVMLRAMLGDEQGEMPRFGEASGPVAEAERLGRDLGAWLRDPVGEQGAGDGSGEAPGGERRRAL